MTQVSNNSTVKSVLFVCMGNICRSPTADAVFRQKAREQGVDIDVDSAGTIAFHQGEMPDKRSREVGEARGYDFSDIRARKVVKEDFENFDLIVAMDQDNLQELQHQCPKEFQHKIKLFLTYAKDRAEICVPDPYYGGSHGFEHVLNLVEDASEGLLREIRIKG
ncbi:low molecular weight protein-tyrosine-phosphatase [Thalassotalea sp. PS06]|uniref:low molecular weight protein-tyrosine-phosphatase n=1 Tax=Thalassotalea sp. PS06 TaxID=2594005 RepID=UPI001163B031|nr:low molecular weight protein-tyrosine-phosphatase [Thalassotalea sp. PS06]QDP01251.1 low molecular weight phosphotyrosine protein phosphatase [Thalassotalea sp. PS06]